MRDLPSSDIDNACIEIFGDLNDLRAAKLKQAVQYYLNGTKDGFLKYRTASGKPLSIFNSGLIVLYE